MDNPFFLLNDINKSELSEDDLAILQAFEAMENKSPAPLKAGTSPSGDPVFGASVAHLTCAVGDDMLTVFATEVEEDIASMQQMLENLKQEGNHNNPAHLMRIKRLGHKLRGTAGAVDFPVMSTIASHIEVIAEQVSEQNISPPAGLYILAQAITALECYLCEIRSHGKEPEDTVVLQALDATYKGLNVGLRFITEEQNMCTNIVFNADLHVDDQDGGDIQDEKKVSARITAPFWLENGTETSQYLQKNSCIDVKRFGKLSQHIEQLVKLCNILGDTKKEAEMALQDLNLSQTRLQHLEPMLSLLLTSSTIPKDFGASISSSLITRIINESRQRHGSALSFRKSQLLQCASAASTTATCDELERYCEKNSLIRSLQESIADVSLTAARLQAAHARLAMVQQEYVSCVAAIRSTTLEMCRVPLSFLIRHLKHMITMSACAQNQQVQFEVTGESIEIDQDILAVLAFPLIQLIHTCMTGAVECRDSAEQRQKKLSRIWLHIQETGSKITMEIGFSITIQAGAIEAIEGAVQRLNGKISLQPNGDGGLSIFLHIPHVQGAVRCLLVRVSLQKLVIPFSQIQRIIDRQRGIFDRIYHLRDLLGFPSPVAAISVEHTQPILVMQEAEYGQIGLAVDEVVGEIDLFIKPLKSYLQRPGIMGTAIDGKGSVTLVVDLLSLMKNYTHSVPLSSRWRVKHNAEKTFSGSQKT